MKTILIYAFVFFGLTQTFSQNLSLDELISLRKKELSEIEEFLTNKNWSFLSAEEPEQDKLGLVTFAFDKSNYDDKAQSFLRYFYSDKSESKRIQIQVNKKEIYNSYLTKLKSLEYKIINSKIENGKIIKIYEGAKIIIEIRIATQKEGLDNTKTYYTLFFVEKDDYYRNLIGE
ncbi:hypothetical protein [Flavobacterium johnsoniae]|uniref:hypothetical protein n=1 Tax=Flavobacterium johnsoniae TaxID=986 RepID=UPI003D9579DC